MTDLAHETATELVAKLKRKEISSVELTEFFIDRIEQHDGASDPSQDADQPPINAVVVRTFEDARAKAREADDALAQGRDLGPLHGLPMTIKESYVMANTTTTWGIEGFRNNHSAVDGLAVSRFRRAGAHFMGKTNVPVELADFQSYNPIYGTTGNPFDTRRTPGGSSGGSAAALAAGFTGLEAGSDIGGSIRNPAHYCGVFGHKPTYGIIPMQGHELVSGMPPVDQAVCGPLARGAEDLHTALDIMAGPAQREALGYQLNLPAADFKQLKDLRVALWPTESIAPVATEIADRVSAVGDVLARLGATVSDTARPNIDFSAAHRNYETLLTAVMSASMTPEAVAGAQAAAEQLDPADQSSNAVNLRASVMPHRAWLQANIQREALRNAWEAFFCDWDILICPQVATTAFPHDHRPMSERTLTVNGDERPYFEQLFWAGIIVNAYLPSTVFPTGLSAEGLPIGLQAVSGAYRDHRCIEFAHQMAQELGGFTAPKTLG